MTTLHWFCPSEMINFQSLQTAEAGIKGLFPSPQQTPHSCFLCPTVNRAHCTCSSTFPSKVPSINSNYSRAHTCTCPPSHSDTCTPLAPAYDAPHRHRLTPSPLPRLAAPGPHQAHTLSNSGSSWKGQLSKLDSDLLHWVRPISTSRK